MAKRARMSDTAALAAPVSAKGNREHSVSVREIANGYMIRQSECNDATGEYKSSEYFSPTAPRITPPKVDGFVGDGQESLGAAMDYLKEP